MDEKMTDKQVEQLLAQLKAKFGNSLTAYVQEGDTYYAKKDFGTAAAIYNLAAEITPNAAVEKKRLDAIEKWLKS